MTQLFDPAKPAYKSPLASADVRNNMISLDSANAGPSAPPYPVEGKQWLDTVNKALMRYIDGAWVVEIRFVDGNPEIDGGSL